MQIGYKNMIGHIVWMGGYKMELNVFSFGLVNTLKWSIECYDS